MIRQDRNIGNVNDRYRAYQRYLLAENKDIDLLKAQISYDSEIQENFYNFYFIND